MVTTNLLGRQICVRHLDWGVEGLVVQLKLILTSTSQRTRMDNGPHHAGDLRLGVHVGRDAEGNLMVLKINVPIFQFVEDPVKLTW